MDNHLNRVDEARPQRFTFIEVEEVMMFEDLGFPDAILKNFFKQFPLSSLLSQRSKFDNKHFLSYVFNGHSYRSTVYNVYYGEKGEQQLSIKLPCDGFRYNRRQFLRTNIRWYKNDGVFILDKSILDEMPFLKQLKEDYKATMNVYCSIKHRRMDIRLKHPSGEAFLMFTFERGLPEFVEDKRLYF